MQPMPSKNTVHIPVLLDEVLGLLRPGAGKIFVDGTLGGGTHTEAITKAVLPGGMVISCDRDISAINRTEQRLRQVFADCRPFPIRFVHANYVDFDEALDRLNIDKIDGMFLDLGLSSDQLADHERGFSFSINGNAPLDLRFDISEGESAVGLLARLSEGEIAKILFEYGEERYSRRIAHRIVEQRQNGIPVKTAGDLADLVCRSVPGEKRTRFNATGSRTVTIDPATRTFQALRIAVNDELGSLQKVLQKIPHRLCHGGVLAVISFHSLEDRIVKNAFRDDACWETITKKPVTASERELAANPRSRSAKLRAAVLHVRYK